MSYFIKIDNREQAFADFMTKDGYGFDLEPLDIGDIQFVDKTSKIPFIIIERKTYADLEASIKDGRYKEQKERMIKAYPYKVRKIILLEGAHETFKMGQKTLNSVIVNSIIRDNISVYCVKNFAELCEFLESIIINLAKYGEALIKETCTINAENNIATFQNELEAYTHSVKTGKKENLTPKIAFRNMLCQINGISNSVADMLVEKYEHMYAFVSYFKEKYNNDYDAMSKELGELKYGSGNGRKIGIASKKIINTIFGTSSVETASVESVKKSSNVTVRKKNSVKSNPNIFNVFSDE